jgi:hypothetical protein
MPESAVYLGGEPLWAPAVFSELDTNNDARVSRSEWRGDAATFNRLDTNGDGLLSENEFNGRKSSSIAEQIFQELFKKQ